MAEATSAPFWYQLYVMRDRDYAADLMARAAAAGCTTLVLTVDLAVVGARYRDTRNGMIARRSALAKAVRALDFATHPGWVRDVAIGGKPHTFGNLEKAVPDAHSPEAFKAWVDAQFDPSVTWDDLAWVREHWTGRIVLKGILDVDDARRAADSGVDGLVVSNHGGRQLDDTPSTAKALPAIADAVGDSLTVLADGGVRSGLDVVKMVALGAQAVLLGRAWAWAVAADGEDGVAHMLDIVRDIGNIITTDADGVTVELTDPTQKEARPGRLSRRCSRSSAAPPVSAAPPSSTSASRRRQADRQADANGVTERMSVADRPVDGSHPQARRRSGHHRAHHPAPGPGPRAGAGPGLRRLRALKDLISTHCATDLPPRPPDDVGGAGRGRRAFQPATSSCPALKAAATNCSTRTSSLAVSR